MAALQQHKNNATASDHHLFPVLGERRADKQDLQVCCTCTTVALGYICDLINQQLPSPCLLDLSDNFLQRTRGGSSSPQAQRSRLPDLARFHRV